MSASYYYKVVKNQWVDEEVFNTDAEYDKLGVDGIGSQRLSELSKITTSTATGDKAIREGFELEAVQNFGFLGRLPSRFDGFVTYTRRPVVAAVAAANPPLGWIATTPVRPEVDGRSVVQCVTFQHSGTGHLYGKWHHAIGKRSKR
ncbi:MAG: hypothetical protein QM760_06140 [Nibricoccus sp.]